MKSNQDHRLRSKRRRLLMLQSMADSSLMTALALLEPEKPPRAPRVAVPRQPHFWETQVPLMSDIEFKRNFRVNRSTFQIILTGVEPALVSDPRGQPLSAEKVCAIGLWRLKEAQQSYQAIGTQFQIGRCTARDAVVRFVAAVLAAFANDYIHLPQNMDEIDASAHKFSEYSRGVFCRAVGAIDGTHIPIHKPPLVDDPRRKYINRKGWPSLNCMAIVDRNKIFVYFNAKWPGSVGDSRIVNCSSLADGKFLPEGYYLLGDAGFALKPWLLTPYRRRPDNSATEKAYNMRFSSSRMVVEQSFGELKQRWRILLHCIYATPELAADMATACVVLHNICRYNDDRLLESWNITDDDDDYLQPPQVPAVGDTDVQLNDWRDDIAAQVVAAFGVNHEDRADE
jgi:hypothetical protein